MCGIQNHNKLLSVITTFTEFTNEYKRTYYIISYCPFLRNKINIRIIKRWNFGYSKIESNGNMPARVEKSIPKNRTDENSEKKQKWIDNTMTSSFSDVEKSVTHLTVLYTTTPQILLGKIQSQVNFFAATSCMISNEPWMGNYLEQSFFFFTLME